MLLWADLFELSGVVNQTDIVVRKTTLALQQAFDLLKCQTVYYLATWLCEQTQLAFGDWVASLKPSTQWVDTVGFTGDEVCTTSEYHWSHVFRIAFFLVLNSGSCPRGKVFFACRP